MNRQRTRELVVMGVLTAVVFVAQVAMGFLPNIELVTLLFILYTLAFGKKVFLMIYVFVLLEGIFYGFGLWWLNYTYIWTVQALVTLVFRKQTSPLFWSVLSGFYGITFGRSVRSPTFSWAGRPRLLPTGSPGSPMIFRTVSEMCFSACCCLSR